MKFTPMLSCFLSVAGLLVTTACEIDLESGQYSGTATGSSKTGTGATSSIDRNTTATFMLAQDAGGVAPDLLAVTLCNDAIAPLTWKPCSEPIEVKVRQNHFGGEEWSWPSATLQDSAGNTHYCEVEENIVISGDILSEDSLSLQVNYYAEPDGYWDSACPGLYTGVVYATYSAELTRL